MWRHIKKREALALVTVNIQKLAGLLKADDIAPAARRLGCSTLYGDRFIGKRVGQWADLGLWRRESQGRRLRLLRTADELWREWRRISGRSRLARLEEREDVVKLLLDLGDPRVGLLAPFRSGLSLGEDTLLVRAQASVTQGLSKRFAERVVYRPLTCLYCRVYMWYASGFRGAASLTGAQEWLFD